MLREDKYGEVVLERLPGEVELPLFQELEEVKLKPSIFGLMSKELVVAPCICLPHTGIINCRYYSAYADDSAALWYELLLKLTVRSYEWRVKLYLTEGGNLRPIPKWYTLFSYVVGKRRRLTKEELAEELAGEQ